MVEHLVRKSLKFLSISLSALLIIINTPHIIDQAFGIYLCPDAPSIPDCSARGEEFYLFSSGEGSEDKFAGGDGNTWRCAPNNTSLTGDVFDLKVCESDIKTQCFTDQECQEKGLGNKCVFLYSVCPECEIFVENKFADCCLECCGPTCCPDPSHGCCTFAGIGTDISIVDQWDSQLNWDIATGSGIHVDTMWDRYAANLDSNSCGSPKSIRIISIHHNLIDCWKSSVRVVRRSGWNRTGTSIASAKDIGLSSSWCGNINETPCGGGSGGGLMWECEPDDPICTENPTWKVYLENGDTLMVALGASTGISMGTRLNLNLFKDEFSKRLVWATIGSEMQEHYPVYTNDGPSDLFYIELNNYGTYEDRPGSDLWEYAINFAVKKAGCVNGPLPCHECNDEGVCEPVPDGISCDDGNVCTSNDKCIAGTCTGESIDCDDSNSCTHDSCNPVLDCQNVNVIDGTSCEDGNPCTINDECVSGQCIQGVPNDCNDNNPCTDDTCDEILGCQHTNVSDGTSCEDERLCNGKELCQGGVCEPGTPLDSEYLELSCLEVIGNTISVCESLKNWRVDATIIDTLGKVEDQETFCSGNRAGEECLVEGIQSECTNDSCDSNSRFEFCLEGGMPAFMSAAEDIQCAVGEGENNTICEVICTGCIPYNVVGNGTNKPQFKLIGAMAVRLVSGQLENSWLLYKLNPKQIVSFSSSQITRFTVEKNRVTIKGIGETNNGPGYTFTAWIKDGSPDEMGIEILTPDGEIYFQDPPGGAGATRPVKGNFTFRIIE